MALSDEEYTRIADEVEGRLENKQKTTSLRKIPTTAKVLLGLAVVGILYLMFGTNITTLQKGILVFISVAVIVLLAGYTNEEPRLLKEAEVVALGHQLLKFKQIHALGTHRQIGLGDEVRMDKIGKLISKEWGGDPYYWEHGVTIIPKMGSVPWYGSLQQDPYTGDIVGLIDREEGFTGREVTPIRKILDRNLRDRLYYERLAKRKDQQ